MAALAVQRFKFFGRETVSLLIVLPIALPGIVTGIALNAAFTSGRHRVRLHHADHRPRHVLHRGDVQQRASPGCDACRRTSRRPAPTSAPTRSRRSASSRSRSCARRCSPAASWRSGSASTRSWSPRSPSAPGLETLPLWIFNNLSRGDQQPIVNVVATAVMLLSIVPVWLAQRSPAARLGRGGTSESPPVASTAPYDLRRPHRRRRWLFGIGVVLWNRSRRPPARPRPPLRHRHRAARAEAGTVVAPPPARSPQPVERVDEPRRRRAASSSRPSFRTRMSKARGALTGAFLGVRGARRHHRRDVGRPRGGAAARRRRRARHRRVARRAEGAGEVARRSPIPTACSTRCRPRCAAASKAPTARCTSSRASDGQPERVAVRRRERRRQDHHHRQGGGAADAREGRTRADGRRRHVPRRRRRAAHHVGRAQRCRDRARQRGRRPERGHLRRHRAAPARATSTSCSPTPPAGCTPRPT